MHLSLLSPIRSHLELTIINAEEYLVTDIDPKFLLGVSKEITEQGTKPISAVNH